MLRGATRATTLDLCVDAGNGAFRATIELPEIDFVVVVIERDLVEAVGSAAQQCSDRLRQQGYTVAAADVLGALGFAKGSDFPAALRALIHLDRS